MSENSMSIEFGSGKHDFSQLIEEFLSDMPVNK